LLRVADCQVAAVMNTCGAQVWTAQQLCEAFSWETTPRYLLDILDIVNQRLSLYL